MTVGLAMVAVCSVAATFVLAGAAAAAAPAQSADEGGEPVALLEIIEPNVSVQREGKENFKPAKEGQKLRVGDTVQTDATGFAQVNYTDDSFTRLDVDTTFTIVSLSDDEGNRQIKGSVESGQTWNRTSALTESETFEQEGAGATAAVTGTAFVVSCTSPTSCTFTSVVDGIQLTTVDGEVQQLEPLEQCGSSEITEEDANLCAAIEQVTLDALLANAWILENLFIDGIEGLEGVLIVEGNEITFTPAPPADEPPADEPEDTPPPGPTADPPVVNPNPVNITSLGSDPTPGETTGENTKVVSQDERADVTFVLQVTNPDHTFYIVFTDLPDYVNFGELYDSQNQLVNTNDHYLITEVYRFVPNETEASCQSADLFEACFDNYPTPVTPGPVSGSVQWSDTFTFKAVNDEGDESPETNVTLVAVDDMCTPGGLPEGHDQDAIDVTPGCEPVGQG